MKGTIRTKEKCPKCKGKFKGEPLSCPTCLIQPHRYFVDIYWKGEGQIKLYSGQDGLPLDSWIRADRLLTHIRHEIDLGKFDPRNYVSRELKPLLFANYIQAWIDRRQKDCERLLISRAYLKEIEAYTRRYFVPFFGRFSIRDLKKRHIEDFLHQLPDHLSTKTVRNILGVLRKLLQDAWEREDIAAVPLFPKIPRQEPITRWIGETEQKAILAHTFGVYRAFFTFVMRTGCRTGEARALRWEDVYLKDEMVVIRAGFDLGMYKPYTKAKEVRYLPLHPEAKAALMSLPRSLAGWVFVNNKGGPLSQRRVITVWRQAASKAGLDITCHEGTRHSFASQAINRGISERKIGDAMGHKHASSTRRYAKLKANSLREVMGLSSTGLSPDYPQTVLEGNKSLQ